MVHVSATGRCTLRDFYLYFSSVEFKIKYKRMFRLKVTSSFSNNLTFFVLDSLIGYCLK